MKNMANIQFQDNTFFIGDKDNPEAALTFKRKDAHTIIADHTFVNETLRGQGVAGQLFQALIHMLGKRINLSYQNAPMCKRKWKEHLNMTMFLLHQCKVDV